MIDLFCLTDEQLSTCIDRLSERINTLQDCKNVMDRTKTYTPHLLNPDEYESLKKSIKIVYAIHHRLLIEYERRNPDPIRYIDFSGGGSHRRIERERRLLSQNKIVHWTRSYGIGRSQYLKTRIRVHRYYASQMKNLGFKKARS